MAEPASETTPLLNPRHESEITPPNNENTPTPAPHSPNLNPQSSNSNSTPDNEDDQLPPAPISQASTPRPLRSIYQKPIRFLTKLTFFTSIATLVSLIITWVIFSYFPNEPWKADTAIIPFEFTGCLAEILLRLILTLLLTTVNQTYNQAIYFPPLDLLFVYYLRDPFYELAFKFLPDMDSRECIRGSLMLGVLPPTPSCLRLLVAERIFLVLTIVGLATIGSAFILLSLLRTIALFKSYFWRSNHKVSVPVGRISFEVAIVFWGRERERGNNGEGEAV